MLIYIRETNRSESAFTVELDVGGVRFPDIRVSPPFGAEANAREALLEWYFEQWLYFPMLDTTLGMRRYVAGAMPRVRESLLSLLKRRVAPQRRSMMSSDWYKQSQEFAKVYSKLKHVKGPSGMPILKEFQYAHAEKERQSRRTTFWSYDKDGKSIEIPSPFGS